MLRYRTWVCPDCHVKVSEDVYPCPFCLNQQQSPRKAQLPKNVCPKCTVINDQNDNICSVCETILKIVEKPNVEGIKCPKCTQENDASNILCVYCEQDLYQTQKKICDICAMSVMIDTFDRHYSSCLLNQEAILKEQQELRQQIKREEQAMLQNLEECIHCRIKFVPEAMELHLIQCKKTALKNLVFDPKTRMTPLQIQAMQYMTLKSQKQHNQAKGALQQRIKKLGYTIQDLNNLQFYVQNYAPIIIHIHISKHMVFFLKDTHYRSQFETNKSSGSLSRASRTQWEDRMFDKKYAKATDFERVKYGVINFTNDPKGVGACVGYGQSYFQLKEHVRVRCTFTDMDSSGINASIATFKYCFKILNKMNDNELKAAFDASKAKEIASTCTTAYKEMQIHGPIEFAKDIERIYVNRNQLKTDKKLLDMVYQFNKKFGVEYDFF